MAPKNRKIQGNTLKDNTINSLGIPVMVISSKLTNITFNKAALKAFPGINHVNDLTSLMNPASAKKFLKNCAAILDKGGEKKQEIVLKKRNWSAKFYKHSQKGITLLLEPSNARKTNKEDSQYRLLIDSMGDAFVLTDENLKIIDANNSFLDSLGLKKGDIIGSKNSTIDKFLSTRKVRSLQKSAEKRPITFHTKNITSKGEVIEAEVNMFMLKQNNKKYFGNIGRAINKYKKTELELEKTHSRITRISNATQDALWELNVQTGERWANENHQALYDLTAKDAVPSHAAWQARIHPTQRAKVINSMEKAIEKKKQKWVSEYWFNTQKGNYIYIYDRTLFIYDADGKLERMMGSMVDVTELRNAQEELNIQRNLSEGIINSLPGVFYLLDRHGELLRWNKNFEKITGFPPSEMRNAKADKFFYQNDIPGLWNKIAEVFQKGKAEMEATLIDYNGVGRLYYLTGWRTIIGNEECLIGTGIDISEMKIAEERVKRMETKIVEQRVQEQKTISRTIINTQEKERNYIGRELHDNVNQLLAGARLYLTMGAKKNDEFAELIRYPIELLDNGIQEIRYLTHRNITPSKDMDLKQLLEGIKDMLGIGSIKCKVSYHLENNLSENLTINVYRILQEQANNIIKHSGAGNVTIKVFEKNNILYIQTSDDGIGFDIHKLREGIGLYNIYSRVEAYNGSIEIKSEDKKGCRIFIKIPISGFSQNENIMRWDEDNNDLKNTSDSLSTSGNTAN